MARITAANTRKMAAAAYIQLAVWRQIWGLQYKERARERNPLTSASSPPGDRGLPPGSYFVGVILDTAGDTNPANNGSSGLPFSVTAPSSVMEASLSRPAETAAQPAGPHAGLKPRKEADSPPGAALDN